MTSFCPWPDPDTVPAFPARFAGVFAVFQPFLGVSGTATRFLSDLKSRPPYRPVPTAAGRFFGNRCCRFFDDFFHRFSSFFRHISVVPAATFSSSKIHPALSSFDMVFRFVFPVFSKSVICTHRYSLCVFSTRSEEHTSELQSRI